MHRPPSPPGAEAQVDYGYLGLWPDPATGRRRRVWAFSMVLPYSRHLFVRPTVSMTQRAWTEAHVAAFEFFGGYACVDHAIAAWWRQEWWRSPPWSADVLDAVPAPVC